MIRRVLILVFFVTLNILVFSSNILENKSIELPKDNKYYLRSISYIPGTNLIIVLSNINKNLFLLDLEKGTVEETKLKAQNVVDMDTFEDNVYILYKSGKIIRYSLIEKTV